MRDDLEKCLHATTGASACLIQCLFLLLRLMPLLQRGHLNNSDQSNSLRGPRTNNTGLHVKNCVGFLYIFL